MPLPGFCGALCCRQGFRLLARDYGDKDEEEGEEEESLELRSADERACNGRGPLEVTVCQPTRTASMKNGLSDVPEEMRSLIFEKGKMGFEEDPELVVKGWLYREVPGTWIWQRRFWFVLTQDSLDYYSSPERGARRLGTLVLTSLCSVIWPDKQTYKETGYWSVTVYGRKHCYRLYTKHFNEAVHWACAVQKVIDSKAPVETPTQILIRDIEENKLNQEVVEHIYSHNPILKYTQSPLYAPLLPFPYGSLDHVQHSGKGYMALRDEAVRLFNSLQQLEAAHDPVPLIQGVLQTCLDLWPLRDEVYCQLVKQTSGAPQPDTQAQLRYWQLLTCMSCTFLPGTPVLKYLRFHLDRTQSEHPKTEVGSYASFISAALKKTRCRECVPSWEEIQVLMGRREMLCVVHFPGQGSCRVPITSHTTADELVRTISERLGLQHSRNTFALFERSAQHEWPVGGSTIIADILTRFENRSAKDPESDGQQRLSFKLYCLLDVDSISADSIEYTFLFEQCHEMMVRGQLPASEEDLQALAALRLQWMMGDFSIHAPCPPLDELFPGNMVEARVLLAFKNPSINTTASTPAPPPSCPQRFPGGLLAGALWSHAAAHKQRAAQDLLLRSRLKEEGAAVMSAIVERWKGLAGYSQKDSMAAYLAIARRSPGFGCTLYEVDFYISSTGNFSQKLWLGVAAKCVSLYRQGELRVIMCLSVWTPADLLLQLSRTAAVRSSPAIPPVTFDLSCRQLTEIMQLMNAYFSATHQHRVPTDRTYPEGGFCLAPSIQELSSPPTV
ncbi:unconventional myosin-X-like [Arapaima gigas]